MPTKQSLQSKNTYRLALGLDPGIGNCGYALVQRFLNRYQLLHSGVIYTSPRTPLGYRLDTHYATRRELLTEHSPDLVSIESVFFNKNISSCISTASVIAIAELAGVQASIPTIQILPQAVKAAVQTRWMRPCGIVVLIGLRRIKRIARSQRRKRVVVYVGINVVFKVERFFSWIEDFRRLVVRWEYHAANYLGFVHLACLRILMRYL